MKHAVAILATFVPAIANAWPVPAMPEPDPAPEPAPEPPPAPIPAPAQPTKLEELEKRLDQQDQRLAEAEAKAAQAQHDAEVAKKQIEQMLPRTHAITAYLDVGAFVVAGNGTGFRNDFLHTQYPQYRNQISGEWVFMGDPFTTMVNTIGEPAEVALSREGEQNTIAAANHPSVIVNTLALGIGQQLTDRISVSALTQFLPRARHSSVDVAYAHVDFRPEIELDNTTLVFEVGKVDSVLGVEYRDQDANKRIGITPSLIYRYTSGRPLGVDARLVSGRLSVSAAVINGDLFVDEFEPKDTLKASSYPTVAGHLQWTLPVGQGLEIGLSGAAGPQDNQSADHVHHWHYGVDLKLTDFHGWNAVAELIQGNQQGSTSGSRATDLMLGIDRARCDVAPCLNYKGAYLLVHRPLVPKLTPYVRVDWRDAVHHEGASFIYESHSVRTTAGVNYEIAGRVTAKLEYNFNYEIGVPYFPHDVLTSSIVVSTD